MAPSFPCDYDATGESLQDNFMSANNSYLQNNLRLYNKAARLCILRKSVC